MNIALESRSSKINRFIINRWDKSGDPAILLVSLLGGVILIFMARTEDIWFAYVGYLLFRMSYQLLMTIASFEIAKLIRRYRDGNRVID